MPHLDFTQHARDQMEARQVLETDVKLALNRQFGPHRPGEPGTIWIDGLGTGNRIIPVCVETMNHDRVITVGWPRAR